MVITTATTIFQPGMWLDFNGAVVFRRCHESPMDRNHYTLRFTRKSDTVWSSGWSNAGLAMIIVGVAPIAGVL